MLISNGRWFNSGPPESLYSSVAEQSIAVRQVTCSNQVKDLLNSLMAEYLFINNCQVYKMSGSIPSKNCGVTRELTSEMKNLDRSSSNSLNGRTCAIIDKQVVKVRFLLEYVLVFQWQNARFPFLRRRFDSGLE